MSDLRRFLIQASMDPDFRERFRTDPDAAMAGFSLTNEERAALKRPDATLPLVAREAPGIREAAASDSSSESPAHPPSPHHVAFFLRVFPEVVTAPDGTLYVSHSGVLDPPHLAVAHPIPWQHRLGLPETQAAAEAVSEARPEDRRARILDLIQHLVQP
jgi:hypothetical protein